MNMALRYNRQSTGCLSDRVQMVDIAAHSSDMNSLFNVQLIFVSTSIVSPCLRVAITDHTVLSFLAY